jgi:hypothetical protein
MIQKSIGEAGNLEIESLRLLKMFDICAENYEKEDGSINKHLKNCLKNFTKNINSETKEWIIP